MMKYSRIDEPTEGIYNFGIIFRYDKLCKQFIITLKIFTFGCILDIIF